MPCSDSSSGLNFFIDPNERFIKFKFAKITCSSEIAGSTGFSEYCAGQTLEQILNHSYLKLVSDLKMEKDEEKQFILHLEWEALRAGIAQYLGVVREDIDSDRCRITSIEYGEKEIEISEVILPPQELPKILPCSLGDQRNLKSK